MWLSKKQRAEVSFFFSFKSSETDTIPLCHTGSIYLKSVV